MRMPPSQSIRMILINATAGTWNGIKMLPKEEAQHRERQNKFIILGKYIKEIESRPLVIDEFDDRLWMASVDKVRVMEEGKLIFCFKDGTEIAG